MFTDMTGYTALTQRDESLALSLLDKQNGILLPLIRAFGGTPVKTIGDAHLAEFDNTLAAIRCAVEIQRKVEMYDKSASPEEGFKLRIGIHLGDVIHKDNDVYGDAVNIAARLQPIAEPGGVCVSQQVYDQVQNKVEFKLERLPARQLRNVNSRINVYRVIDSKAAPASIVEEEDQPKERVAVLPLSNFSPSQQDEYLADGMTEELITAISGVQGLRVIARTSVMRFKNAGVDIAEIGRTLGVGTVLQGSFRKAGDRIRVTVQLIDAKSEEHVWASNYDGDLKDIFSIQTDIANKVAQVLKVKLLERAATVQKPVNIEAYELYLKGRSFWNRRTKEGVYQALKLFNLAIEKDPSFAKAYSGVADCYTIGRQHLMFEDEAKTNAEASIQKALKLDDSVAEAHASRGLLLCEDYRFAEGEDEFKKALTLNQSYASAHHWYAMCLADLGRLEEAIVEASLASQSDPLAAPPRNVLGEMYIYERQYDKALEVFNEILKMEPDFRPTINNRSAAYALKGMKEASQRDLDRYLRDTNEFEKYAEIAIHAAWFGERERALKSFDQAEKYALTAGESEAKTHYEKTLPTLRTVFYAVLGDTDGFFKWCHEAVDSKELRPEELRYAPWFDKMRSDPRYSDLIDHLPA
jgi:adenylate cyclase